MEEKTMKIKIEEIKFEEMEEKIKELGKAKRAVVSCLSKDGVLVDMHDLEYWAGVVVRLRKEIKEML